MTDSTDKAGKPKPRHTGRREDLALVADRKPGRPPASEAAKKTAAKKSKKGDAK